MRNTDPMENQNTKIATSIRIDTDVYEIVAQLAAEEDRPSQANMIERLIKTHPRVVAAQKPEASESASAV